MSFIPSMFSLRIQFLFLFVVKSKKKKKSISFEVELSYLFQSFLFLFSRNSQKPLQRYFSLYISLKSQKPLQKPFVLVPTPQQTAVSRSYHSLQTIYLTCAGKSRYSHSQIHLSLGNGSVNAASSQSQTERALCRVP